MEPNAYREQVWKDALAALSGLEAAVRASGTHDVVVLAAVLERAGDLRRLDEPLPDWCRQWLAGASEAALDAVVDSYNAEVARWPVPQERVSLAGPAEGASPGEQGLGFVLRRRDDIESALVTILSVSLQRGRAPVQLPSWSSLYASLRTWETAIGEVLDRSTAEDLLVERIALTGRRQWLELLPTAPLTEGDTKHETVPAFEGSALVGEPDDVTLDAYLSSGAMQKYVEGCANRSPEFAEKLAEMIEALKDLGELSDALVPRRWHRQHRNAPTEALRYLAPIARLAAADSEEQAEAHRINLGAVPGLAVAVDAVLEVTTDDLILRVESEGPLQEVRLGDTTTLSAQGKNSWIARSPRRAGSIQLRIKDSTGHVFEDEFTIEAKS